MAQFFTKENLLRLKQDIDLVFVVGGTVNLVQKGQRFIGACPFHKDNGQSLVVSPKKNLWFCHGACKKGGSIVDWVACLEKISIGAALFTLAQRYPFLAKPSAVAIEGDQAANIALSHEAIPEQYQPLLLQLIEDYSMTLHKNKKAVRYLYGLGLSYPLVQQFKIGFNDGSLFNLIPASSEQRDDHKLFMQDLLELGVLGQQQGEVCDRFANCLLFPIFDDQGQCLQLFARPVPTDFSHQHMQILAS